MFVGTRDVDARQASGPYIEDDNEFDPEDAQLAYAGRCVVENLRRGGEVDDLTAALFAALIGDYRLDHLRTSVSDVLTEATTTAIAVLSPAL